LKKSKNQKIKKNVTYKPTYKGLAINTGKYKNLGVYTTMLKPMLNQIDALLTYHSRIQLLRFDLHLPVTNLMTASLGNLVVSKFFKQVKQDLASANWNHQKNVIQGWAREVGDSINGHYHCYIGVSSTVRLGTFYDGTPTLLWRLLYNRWEEASGGSVRPSCCHIVNRNNHKQLSDAFFHLSYMCKVRSKDFGTGEDHKRYSNSRLKPKKVADQYPDFDIDHSDKAFDITDYQSQFSDYVPSPERISVQLLTIDDGAVAGNDAPYKRPTHRGSKTKEMADQQIITDCHMTSLEQFFVPTISPAMVISNQLL
jgi:hypothetical protein